ncbi:MAG: asparagine synthase (glutamine-hydrolyzing) [Propionicimonas sp.]|nr:asparagine synthase (glutamine-hydrolyzing) [Propionicimonas sp.]
MCGICGTHSPGSVPEVDAVTAMMAAIGHRGPDGSGYYRDERVALGHVRLAIIDTAHGEQPMCNEDGTVWVSFNGEIFNYVELMAQLKDRGHVFATHCDTEAIVHAWEEWGPGCFDRFNGQWAVAIWDRRAGELVLSRDRFGVRPLYWTTAGDRLLFASEVKALFTDPAVTRELDPIGLDQALTFWSTVAPRTVFAGVRQVPPGSYLRVRGDSRELHRYWEPGFPERGTEPVQDIEENARLLRQAVVDATRLRFLRSDVPVGAYLSGGIDSAVTASAIAHFTDADLHTFSLRFADSEFDEGHYQRLMSQRLGTVHRDIVVSERDIGEILPEVVWHAENPLLRMAPAPMFLLSRLVRQAGYKVVVTGEGADEVLAGYDLFREARVRQFWARDPGSPARARAVELLYPWMRRSPNLAPAFAQSFFSRNLDPDDPALSHRPRWDSTGVLKSMLADTARATGLDAAAELVAGMPAASVGWDPLSRAQYLEMTTLLPGYILASQGDRMLMANGVEGRFPFLDPNVASLAAGFPARQKLLGLDEKHLLKRAFADLLPSEVVDRPKQPYRSPDAASLFAQGSPDWLDDVTSEAAVEAAGVFRPAVTSRLLAKCRKAGGLGLSNTDNMRLAAIASVQLLHHQFIAGRRTVPQTPPGPVAAFDHAPTKENHERGVRA